MALSDVSSFEAQIADAADQLLAVRALLHRLSVNGWRGDTGAGYEQRYNDGVLTADQSPTGGTITQNEMNNAINAINSILAAIDTAAAPLAIVAEHAPKLS